VHLTGGYAPRFQAFSLAQAGSLKWALSCPSRQQVTHTVSQPKSIVMNNHQTNTLSSFLDLFPKLANYAVGFTLLCYLTGFAIANMYLGSLGIINLDVLRTKYILVGLLFLLFIGAIAYLIYGLYQAICKNFEEPTSKLIKNVIWYSLQNLAVLFFAVSSIALLAGSVTALPVGLPKISQSTPWSVWLSVGPQKALASSAALVAIFILTAIIVLLVFILINPKDKDGIKRPRKQQLAGIFVLTKSDFLKALGGIFALFLFSCIFLLSSSLISFLTNNNFSASSNSTDFLSSGWGRYLGGISLIYIVIATFVLMVNLPKNSVTAETDLSFGNPMRFISAKIYLVTLAIA